MNYGEAKSVFMSVMEGLKLSATIFDFAQAFDDGVNAIVLNMPADTIPDMIKVYTTDINEFTPRQVTLPSDYLRCESIRLAKERVVTSPDGVEPLVYGAPIFLPATVVSQREFLNKSQYSSTPVVAFFNSLLNYNPALPEELAGFGGPVELSYRRMPDGYIRRYSTKARGALISILDQDSANTQLFTMTTLDELWSDNGMVTANILGGQIVFTLGGYVYHAKVDYAWDDTGGTFSGLKISDETSLPLLADTKIDNAYVNEMPSVFTAGEVYFNSDNMTPDLPEAFHRLALDYAIGKYLLSRRPDIAQTYMSLVIQTFQSLGVVSKIEYGGEEQ